MENKKVAIVGGGICGLYLSWKLAEKGFKVTVFEKNKQIGKEVCSGLFSQRILDFIPGSQDLVKNEIEYALLHFPKKTIKIKFSKRFFVMNHAELDRRVEIKAKEAGVKVILDKIIKDFLPEGFDRIIGCDGSNSEIRKILRLKNPRFRVGMQRFISGENCSDSKESFVETWPTKSGFLWKIPRIEKLEYGIIEKADIAKPIFNQFLREKNISPEGIRAALIPDGFIVPQNKKITLCGDSLGLTKPWSGGGVIWGLTAADILLKNFPDFLKYRKELNRFFLPRVIFSKTATFLAYFLGFKLPIFIPKEIKIESDFLI
jgi:flavin-dependent dehydrogenase